MVLNESIACIDDCIRLHLIIEKVFVFLGGCHIVFIKSVVYDDIRDLGSLLSYTHKIDKILNIHREMRRKRKEIFSSCVVVVVVVCYQNID